MAERENVIDFTVPYYDLVGISILMAKPQVSTSLFKFLTVLENDVWGCILAAYFFTRLNLRHHKFLPFHYAFKLFLFISILLWIFDRWSPYSYQNNKEKYADDPEEEKREFSLKESLWFCMTSLTPQVSFIDNFIKCKFHYFIGWNKLGRWRISKAFIGPSDRCHLVALWFHHHRFVHGQVIAQQIVPRLIRNP